MTCSKARVLEVTMICSIKHDLFRLVNYDMEVGNQKHIVSNAIELFVESYSKSLRDNADSILPPVLIALKEHSYE